MKKILLISGLALLPPVAFANGGTCASPAPLVSLSSDASGDTCGGDVGINMGGAIYPHPSRVYSFHVNHAGPDGTPLTISLTGANREASVTDSCANAPVAVAAPGLPINANALADGDWLLIVSTDPSLPVTNPPTCGAYSVTAGVLPIALQNFTVE